MMARAWMAAALLAAMPATATAQVDRERAALQIKAVFLYKFGDFVEWPADAFAAPDSPFVIGVSGADALADELALVVAQRQVSGRTVVVHKLRSGAAETGLQVLFVGGGDAARLGEALEASRGRPTLTVTESESSPPPASMINFVLVDDRVRFDVALDPAGAAKLKLSSRLLKVARRVVGGRS